MSLHKSIFPTENAPEVASPSQAECCGQNQVCTAESKTTVQPSYTLHATETGWMLNVRMPGVQKDKVSLTDEQGVITIRGERVLKTPESWTPLYRETDEADYELSLEHDGEVDSEKIRATFSDGALQVTLPKIEALKPRSIAIS